LTAFSGTVDFIITKAKTQYLDTKNNYGRFAGTDAGGATGAPWGQQTHQQVSL